MSHYTDEQEARQKRELAEKLKRAEKEARRKAVKERERFRGLQIRPTASFYDDAEMKEPGEDNWVGLGFDIHPHVTVLSTLVLVVFILLTMMFREQATGIFSGAMSFITATFGWFLIMAANIFVLAAIFFAFSRFGRIRIGGSDAKPEFTTLSWFAMLLSAGMGIGLMFWSVGEPMYHYSSPSPMFSGVEGYTPDAVQRRLRRVKEDHRMALAIEKSAIDEG